MTHVSVRWIPLIVQIATKATCGCGPVPEASKLQLHLFPWQDFAHLRAQHVVTSTIVTLFVWLQVEMFAVLCLLLVLDMIHT